MLNIFLLSLLVGISNSAPAGWWASDITYSLNELKSVADYENQKGGLFSEGILTLISTSISFKEITIFPQLFNPKVKS